MRESTVVNEWIAEGYAEGWLKGWRAVILEILQVRFRAHIPADLATAIENNSDADELCRWLTFAVTADSLDTFRAAVQR